ncbi:MAG: hypothetical protein FWJ87_16465, partial [Micromonosporaceae bacterium]
MSAQVDRSPPWPTAVDLSRAPRTLSRPRLRTRTQVWLVFATIVAAGAAAYVFGRRYTFFDVKIYHGAVEW